LRASAALGAHARAEVRRRHDHRHAARDVIEHGGHYALALVVGQRELLGEVREDAESVRARVHHEVDAAPLAFEVERAVVVEDRRRHWEDAAVGALERARCHAVHL
jgi:hypothetical protein